MLFLKFLFHGIMNICEFVMHKFSLKNGFTLLELLIVIAIMAILTVVIFLVINPSEILKKSRDSQRISDLATLKKAIGVYQVNNMNPKIAGINNYGCRGTIADTTWQPTDYIYYSYPNDGVGTPITSKTLDGITFTTGGAYQVPTMSLSSIDGIGWLPVNFASIFGGSPISNLPVDPVNKITDPANPNSTDLVYRYVCSEKTLRYEIDATLESKAYTIDNNLMSKDGGNNDSYYEAGTDLSLFYNENLVSGCVASCTNNVCGDDGCGGSCGNCINNETCNNGTCQAPVFVCGQSFVDPRDSHSYSTVNINGQCWFKENLRATKYNDNSNILNLTTNLDWQNDLIGAYSWYNNDYTIYGSIYGALYNFYAVNSGKLCPAGWRVPTDADFKILVEGQSTASCESSTGWQCSPAGDNLKESGATHWNSSNTGTNISGFTALAGGYRNNDGSFYNRGTFANFWSSSLNGSNVWDRFLSSSYQTVYRNSFGKPGGFSVRCLKN